MTATLPFELPSPPGTEEKPQWTGEGFRVNGRVLPVLAYEVAESGWDDELTDFHEATAGESHFIDILSRSHAIAELKRAGTKEDGVLMDIGCASGFLIKDMHAAFPRATVMGADYIVKPLYRLAREMPGTPLLQFDLTDCPLPSESLDAVTLLNVLEHIEDDGQAARELYRILKPGGVAFIEVPANPGLYDYYDTELMHFRRYTMGALTRVLESAGLKIARKRHLGVSIYPPFWLVKKWHRAHPPKATEGRDSVESDINRTRSMSAVVAPVLAVEKLLLDKFYVPFGIRCDVTVVKPA